MVKKMGFSQGLSLVMKHGLANNNHCNAACWFPKSQKIQDNCFCKIIMFTVYWNYQGILLMEFMAQGITINTEAYCQTLRKIQHVIQNKRWGLLRSNTVLVYGNIQLHTTHDTGAAQLFSLETIQLSP